MPSAAGPCPDTEPLSVELAVRFVLRESASLAAALRALDDHRWVAEALGWHDEAHRPWLALLGAAHRLGWSCRPALDRLYSFHGRVAELLDRGCLPDEALQALVETHLRQLTDDAVAALRGAATPAADAVTTWPPARPARVRGRADGCTGTVRR